MWEIFNSNFPIAVKREKNLIPVCKTILLFQFAGERRMVALDNTKKLDRKRNMCCLASRFIVFSRIPAITLRRIWMWRATLGRTWEVLSINLKQYLLFPSRSNTHILTHFIFVSIMRSSSFAFKVLQSPEFEWCGECVRNTEWRITEISFIKQQSHFSW